MTVLKENQVISNPSNGDRFRIFYEIGSGGFGKVYKAITLESNEFVAIKVIEKEKIDSNEKLRDKIDQEINIHKKLQHSEIVNFYGNFYDEYNIYILLELCKEDLEQYRQKFPNKQIDQNEVKEIIYQIVKGIAYLKTLNLMHRDLKLSNILFSFDHCIKIADFGLAKQIIQERNGYRSECHTVCGTLPFMSPEVAAGGYQDNQCDIWALGCILYTLLIGYAPFNTNGKEPKAVLTNIVMDTYQEIPTFVSSDAKDLIKRCLEKNPRARINISEVYKHNFLKSMQSFDKSLGNDSGVGLSSSQTRTKFSHDHFDLSDHRRKHTKCDDIGMLVKGPLKPLNCDIIRFTPSIRSSKASFNILSQHSENRNVKISKEFTRPNNVYDLTKVPLKDKTNIVKNSHHSYDNIEISSSHNNKKIFNDADLDFRMKENQYSDLNDVYLQSHVYSLVSSNSRKDYNHCKDHLLINSFECKQDAKPYYESTKQKSLVKEISLNGIAECDSSYSHESHLAYNNNRNRLFNNPSSPLTSNVVNDSDRTREVDNAKVLHKISNSSNEEKKLPSRFRKKMLRQYCQPLSTRRLMAKRHKAKNSILHILDMGDVFIEDIKFFNGQELVQCSYRISSDGLRIAIYYPKNEMGDSIKENPSSEFSAKADKLYGFENLPREYYSKYICAVKFVDMLKAHTAKVSFFSDQAKCILMENSPNPDFEAIFYSGESVILGKLEIQIRNIVGESLFHRKVRPHESWNELEKLCRQILNQERLVLFNHAIMMRNHCLKLEQQFTDLEGTSDQPYFPVIIGKKFGKRLTLSNSSNTPASNLEKINFRKENVTTGIKNSDSGSPSVFDGEQINKASIRSLSNPPKSITSSVRSSSVRQVIKIKNKYGTIRDNGNSVYMDFSDGSSLCVKKAEVTKCNFPYQYYDKHGNMQKMDKEKNLKFCESIQMLKEKIESDNADSKNSFRHNLDR